MNKTTPTLRGMQIKIELKYVHFTRHPEILSIVPVWLS